jgi:hypothetical protein
MLKNHCSLKSVADVVTKAAKQTIEKLSDGRVEQEANFTDRLLDNIENQLNGKIFKGIHWKAKTLTALGRQSQESIFGADFLGILTLKLTGLHVTKGFFAQAKLIRHSGKLTKSSEFERLQEQCKKMLNVTPDSYVFIYSKRGIKIIPASLVMRASAKNINSLSNRTIGQFFKEYVICLIGDRKLRASTLKKFYKLAKQYEVRQGLYIHASDEGDHSE